MAVLGQAALLLALIEQEPLHAAARVAFVGGHVASLLRVGGEVVQLPQALRRGRCIRGRHEALLGVPAAEPLAVVVQLPGLQSAVGSVRKIVSDCQARRLFAVEQWVVASDANTQDRSFLLEAPGRSPRRRSRTAGRARPNRAAPPGMPSRGDRVDRVSGTHTLLASANLRLDLGLDLREPRLEAPFPRFCSLRRDATYDFQTCDAAESVPYRFTVNVSFGDAAARPSRFRDR